jgi:PKD repeat protein
MKILKSKLRITQLSKLKLLLLLIVFIPTSLVYATSSNFSAWQSIYPNSTSGDNASCQLCHAASTQDLNPYGRDLCVSGAGSINNRILDVESLNSDTDPTSSDNLTEITANTQPGWTPGNVNPTYSRNNCQATGVVELPPSFISGDMDPATTNQPPVADAGGPYSGTVNVAMTFDGSASTDSDGSIVSYSWNFGDGNTATGVSPTHTYLAAGTFNVTLTVTDDVGDTGTNTTTATIGQGNQPPVADANGPYSGTVNVALTFDGSASTDPDGTIVSYNWDFGDGNSGTGATPTHTYTTANTYNVTLTVTDNMNASDSAGTTAKIVPVVVNQPPVADAGGPYTGTAGVALTFDGSGSSDPDGTIVSYSWDFGDGNTGTGVSPSHTYGANGNYTVSLTVTDNQSATGSTTTTASIGAVNQPPVSDPGGPYSGTVNIAVTFDGSGSSDSDGKIVSYNWDFGDGNTGTGVSPSHTYSAAGTFTVSLTVTDDAGDTGTAKTTAVIGLGNKPPVANPNGPYSGTVGVAVAFDGTGSSDPDGTIVSYSWDFGDGNTGSGVSPSHTYTVQGTYNVTLTVTDNANATDSAMTTATIVPVAGGKADVFLIKMKAPKDIDIETGETKSEDIKVKGDGDTIEQDAKVSLSVISQNGVTVKLHPQAMTKMVSPFDDATKYKFKAEITCHVAGDYELVWSATISAAENSNTSNDTLTGSTQVSCKTSDDDNDDEHHDDKDDDHHDSMKED